MEIFETFEKKNILEKIKNLEKYVPKNKKEELEKEKKIRNLRSLL